MMNKEYVTYYIEKGKIKMDFIGIEGFSTIEEAKLYLDWVINFNK